MEIEKVDKSTKGLTEIATRVWSDMALCGDKNVSELFEKIETKSNTIINTPYIAIEYLSQRDSDICREILKECDRLIDNFEYVKDFLAPKVKRNYYKYARKEAEKDIDTFYIAIEYLKEGKDKLSKRKLRKISKLAIKYLQQELKDFAHKYFRE